MRTILYLCLFSFLSFPSMEVSATGPSPERGNIRVYLFLGEECVISQQYTLLIRRLHQEYADEKVQFWGLFPNPSSNEQKIKEFQSKYELKFELKHDALQQEMDRFGVRVTPEVVVYQTDKRQVLYQGRIDNTFFRVGKRRTITTTSELEDVLKALQNGEKIISVKTEAVGCYITPLDARLKKIPMCNTMEGGTK